ncbi:hypothetical protein LCGC14_2146600 [marine sediment metagenome]|uniref:Uncharacterized protein n=1 Tax=marine sediment metagenome TaxID=412755 RepID=A0A0F9EJ25_9ZZZZ
MNNDEIKKAAKGIADYLSEYPLWDYGAKGSIQEIQDLVGKLRRLAQSDLRTAKDEGRVKPGCGLFSNMCSEEIKEVAIRLHTDKEYVGTGLKLLLLIGNLADVVMNLEKKPVGLIEVQQDRCPICGKEGRKLFVPANAFRSEAICRECIKGN